MERIKRIVFVCTGNTDRSPMALAVARHEAMERNMSIELDSCGISARSGCPAGSDAVYACDCAGLDISGHLTKNISGITDTDDTLYAVMSEDHASYLRDSVGIPDDRITVLGSGIADPSGSDEMFYRLTLRRMTKAVRSLFDSIF